MVTGDEICVVETPPELEALVHHKSQRWPGGGVAGRGWRLQPKVPRSRIEGSEVQDLENMSWFLACCFAAAPSIP